MLILVVNLQVHLLSNCAYYPGAKPGKKHALNNQYALNSKLRLLTRVYGILGMDNNKGLAKRLVDKMLSGFSNKTY